MIEGQRQVTHRADGDGVIEHHRNFLDRADAENRYLRLIDHGRGEHAAEAAEVGDGEGSRLHFIGAKLA